jgi:hypothetical protein
MLNVPCKIVWSQDHVQVFLYAWHVLKAWRLCSMESIKDAKMKRAILNRLYTVMFMSLNPNETITSLKARGREMVVESFDNLQPCVAWTRYFSMPKHGIHD